MAAWLFNKNNSRHTWRLQDMWLGGCTTYPECWSPVTSGRHGGLYTAAGATAHLLPLCSQPDAEVLLYLQLKLQRLTYTENAIQTANNFCNHTRPESSFRPWCRTRRKNCLRVREWFPLNTQLQNFAHTKRHQTAEIKIGISSHTLRFFPRRKNSCDLCLQDFAIHLASIDGNFDF